MVVVGHSAGGHLAAAALLELYAHDAKWGSVQLTVLQALGALIAVGASFAPRPYFSSEAHEFREAEEAAAEKRPAPSALSRILRLVLLGVGFQQLGLLAGHGCCLFARSVLSIRIARVTGGITAQVGGGLNAGSAAAGCASAGCSGRRA